MLFSDLPTPAVLVDRQRLPQKYQPRPGSRERRGRIAETARENPQIPCDREVADRARRGRRSAAPRSARPKCSSTPGSTNIRLAYPVNPSNAARVLALMDRASISIIVDHLAVARGWSEAMRRGRPRRLTCSSRLTSAFIDAASIRTADALEFIAACRIAAGAALARPAQPCRPRLSGGVGRRAARHRAPRGRDSHDAARSGGGAGIALEELSVGATPTLRFSAAEPGLTELRPGNYVYFDRTQLALGAASLDDCALTVLATVVSKPAPDRIILDCGSKTLTNDLARGIRRDAGLRRRSHDRGRLGDRRTLDDRTPVRRARDRVRVTGTTLEPGDRVRVLPNHSCVVANLVDRGRLVEGDRVIDSLPVAARGKTT